MSNHNKYMKCILFLCTYLTITNAWSVVEFGSGSTHETINSASELQYLKYVRYMTVPENRQAGLTWHSGDDVSGKTEAEVHAIVLQITALESPLQRIIFNRMYAGNAGEIYIFANTDVAKANVKMRLLIIDKLKQMNDTKFYYYGHPKKSDAPEWVPGDRPEDGAYFQQVNETAYQAAVDLTSGVYHTTGECFGAIVACIWWGASQALGEEKFNLRHPGVTALNMLHTNTWHTHMTNAVDVSPAARIPGDWLYLENWNYGTVKHDDNFKKKKWIDFNSNAYLWSGENCIVIGEDVNGNILYNGLGGFNNAITEADLRESLRVNYNDDLSTVIANEGVIDGGLVVVNIQPGADAVSKIRFLDSSHMRPSP